MDVPSSFCSLSTVNCWQELYGLLISLSIHHPGAKMYCMVDSATKMYIDRSTPQPRLDIKWIVTLDYFSNKNRSVMEREGIWTQFLLLKCEVMREALKNEPDTLFLDTDMVIFDKIDGLDKTKEVGVSPHYINKDHSDKYGYYNGGMLWAKHTNVVDDWILFAKTSRFFDQAAIEELVKKYTYFEFGLNYNFSWWRLYQSSSSPQQIASNISFNSSTRKLCYADKPIKNIHTHFSKGYNDAQIVSFNQLIIEILKKFKIYEYLLLLNRIHSEKWIITLPKQPLAYPWEHPNDSFRGMLSILNEVNSDLYITESKQVKHIWLYNVAVLYDRDNEMWMEQEALSSKVLLLGNGDVNVFKLKYNNNIILPWSYWARNCAVLEQFVHRPMLSYNERTVESIFIGNVENRIQGSYRNQTGWENVISVFHVTGGTKHKFTPEEYHSQLMTAKFGLCLRGFGAKCHREVECIGLGTVPIITPHVNVTSYIDPLIEGKHFVRINSPNEYKNKISQISQEEWERMSRNCREWYMKNVHSSNFWKNTIEYLLYDSVSK
jgi:hypothetical protein